ncbi:hypothetical protein [Flavitalea sp.]|nr:hypothetical protein [Flavitalea sp.]
MKLLLILAISIVTGYYNSNINIPIERSFSVDSTGACQGIAVQNDRIFLYGDREVGVIREYKMKDDSLVRVNNEIRLTMNDTDVINHPTGIAYQPGQPVFIGNSIRLNKEGTLWKAVIYHINWEGLQKTRTLDGNLKRTISDDACVQGTRPEYVKYKNKWYVATADYGGKNNEVRLYDPVALSKADSTSQKNVVFKKFSCSPWVQNIHFIEGRENIVVLVQNQIEGRRWRLTFLDLSKSLETGKEYVVKVVDTDRADELEGFAFLDKNGKAIAVSSSRKNNVNMMTIKN